MTVYEEINSHLKSAMKEGRKEEVGIYRMILSEIKNLAIAMNQRDEITDEMVMTTLTRGVKTRQASVEMYRAGGREDLAQKEEYEIKIITGYLPKALSREEIVTLVLEAVKETGAQGPKDMGKVMKIVMPKTQGCADGKVVKDIVMEQLNA
ncbi:MAG: GatB/YqeY domain-containing protein [Planctomycetota bacterium]